MNDEVWIILTTDKWGSIDGPARLEDVQTSIDELDRMHNDWTGENVKTVLMIDGEYVKDKITGTIVGELFEYPY